MKAVALQTADRPAGLIEVPKPELADDAVLVAIRAASVNGFDVFQANGYMVALMEHRFPTIVGRDFAGVVESVGSSNGAFSVGDEVFGFVPSVPPLSKGAFAEYIAGGDDLVMVRKPTEIDFNTAAALPLAGSAALDLLDAIGGSSGQVVVVVGATGGVGSLLVQLAARRGLTVIGTARPDEAAFVRELGAVATIDYRATSVTDSVRDSYPSGVDALIDLVNRGEAFAELASVVRPGGHAATLLGAADVEALAARGLTGHNINAAPTPEKLRELGALVATGVIRVPIQAVYPMDHATEALQTFEQGTRGKLIVGIGAATQV